MLSQVLEELRSFHEFIGRRCGRSLDRATTPDCKVSTNGHAALKSNCFAARTRRPDGQRIVARSGDRPQHRRFHRENHLVKVEVAQETGTRKFSDSLR